MKSEVTSASVYDFFPSDHETTCTYSLLELDKNGLKESAEQSLLGWRKR